MITEQMFPIQASRESGSPTQIPWRLLDDGWARLNHDQGLERLAERGGLSPCEALAVIERRKWTPIVNAGRMLAALLRADEMAPLLEAAEVLHKWHNWIATGQLDFRPDILDESEAVLKRLGHPVIDRSRRAAP